MGFFICILLWAVIGFWLGIKVGWWGKEQRDKEKK